MEPVVLVNDVAAREIKRGSLHVFAQNVLEARARNGDWVEVRHGEEVLGYGFYSNRSSIPVKIYSRDVTEPLEAIFERMDELLVQKRRLYRNSFRWVFAEADLIPGLVVDVFEDIAVIRISVYGLDRYREDLADYIVSSGWENVVERSEGTSRKREGLSPRRGLLRGKKFTTVIEEGDARFYVDALRGQKTGFYLDQRENRLFSEKFGGGRALDVFSYTGGFGIHLGLAGSSVTFVELGRDESEVLKRNIELNGVEGSVVRGDALDVMKGLLRRGERYDVVVLDPPALAKGRDTLERAKKTYFLLNRLAIRLVKPGGVLLTSSCSQPLTPRDFLGILRGASQKEGRVIRVLGGIRGQAPDHTYYPPHPETAYLKFVAAVVE